MDVTKKWDVFYLGDRVAESIEAATPARACADYLRFSEEIGERVKLDWLVARPAAGDEFVEPLRYDPITGHDRKAARDAVLAAIAKATGSQS